MSFGTGFAIYFIIWWITLFIVLPIGISTQEEDGDVVPGTVPSAPTNPRLGRKLLINSVVALGVFGVYWLLTGPMGLTFGDLPRVFDR